MNFVYLTISKHSSFNFFLILIYFLTIPKNKVKNTFEKKYFRVEKNIITKYGNYVFSDYMNYSPIP